MYFREICGRIRSNKFCEFCVFCGRMLLLMGLAEGAVLALLVQLLLCWRSSCSVDVFLARLVHLRQVHPLSVPSFASAVRSVSVRCPIGFRSPSDQIPFAVRLDSVRRPIGFRSLSDWIPFAVRSDSVRRPIGFRPPSDRIPSAVRLDSVRRRWKSVGKNVARTLCSTAILSATSPSLT